MAFAMYCLVSDDHANLGLDVLAARLQEYFAETEGFRQDFEEDPFDSKDKNLLLSWGEWWVRVFCEAGVDVQRESVEIARFSDPSRVHLVSSIDRRVRVLFADDGGLEYTNHIIWMMDFFEAVPGFIIFDPQKNSFVN